MRWAPFVAGLDDQLTPSQKRNSYLTVLMQKFLKIIMSSEAMPPLKKLPSNGCIFSYKIDHIDDISYSFSLDVFLYTSVAQMEQLFHKKHAL